MGLQDLQKRFVLETEDIFTETVDLIKDCIRNPQLKMALRLKAAALILERTVPTLKSVEHKGVQPTQFIIITAQERAAEVLATAKYRQQVLASAPLEEGAVTDDDRTVD